MHPNNDKIAKVAKGRFFACTVPEVFRLIEKAGFSAPEGRKRLDLHFKNPTHLSEIGAPVASLYPSDTIIVYSFGDDFSPILAKSAVASSLERLAILARREPQEQRRCTSISLRAYLGALGKLTFTRRVRVAKEAKYRGGAKFSNAFKPSAVNSEERIIDAIELA